MADAVETGLEVRNADCGKIIFADDVIATIAALAAADVQGVASMSGGVVEGLTEMLGKKNLTKGVKVEVGSEEAAVDISRQRSLWLCHSGGLPEPAERDQERHRDDDGFARGRSERIRPVGGV